jgi:hypothetical protein
VAAAVLTESEAAKAATTSAGGEVLYFSFPIEKREETKTVNPVDGTPDIEIWGKATDGTLDSDLQIVDPGWSVPALKTWFQTGGNVRFQHDPHKPIGKGIEVDGHYVRALIAEPTAKHLVRSGVLNDFSVGIMNPDIRRGDPSLSHLDPAGKAVNGIITGRPDGMTRIGEVSAVDRGSNFGTKFSMCKAAADGSALWTGELTAPDEVLAKAAVPAKPKTVTVELPKNMSLSVKPSDLAKLVALKRTMVAGKAAQPGPAEPAVVTKAAEPDATDAELDAVKAAEVTAYKRDIDTATRRRLAGEGRALSNLSYPVETHEDASNAVTLLLSGHGNVAAARRMVSRIARKEGWKDILERLKGTKKDKVAEPAAVKCGKCDGSGMADGKPCAGCKKGRKMTRRMEKAAVRSALAPEVAKKKKVLCGRCGAKQSAKHQACTECGQPMTGAAPLTKNHDFKCLGCGKDPLDKGEKHCPGCGKENPGYNPMADHKIPMNAGKSAKERVTKKRKAKGKGNPFGDKQAPPFGAKDDAGDDAAAAKKPAKGKAKKTAQPATAKRKGKGKGRRPDHGVAGHDGDTKGLPAHREPDGAPVEEFENDANLQDGDERQELAAALRHKALGAQGMSREDALLHDLTCPAFRPADVAKCFPYATFADINGASWQQKALMKAASGDPSAMAMRDLFRHAETLKNAPPDVLAELREQNYAAFLEANKVLTDATPGPGSFPTPGHVTPQQFRRPYLDAGHAAESPQAGPAHSFGVPTGQPSAEDFTRPYITEGRAADAPANDTPRHEPIPAPMTPGMPSRVYYTGAMRDNARQAMTAMHDHIAHVFPDVCPVSPDVGDIQKPAPQVPEGVGGPAPRSGKKTAKAVKAAARKHRRALAAKRRRLERKVLKGTMTVKQARRELGLKTKPGKPVKLTAAAKAAAAPVPVPLAAGLLDTDVIKAAVAEACAPLLERQARLERDNRKLRKVADAIAGQADTTHAPLRGVTATKASAAPAAPRTATATAEQVQLAELQRLQYVSRTSPDPGMREAARRDLENKLGLGSTTTQP